ncbi:MAG TPA: ribonuclease P protein component [Patescibacteria group bacterium]|nr:ribonuclease P protein component [Patescibacteria group bacterium]
MLPRQNRYTFKTKLPGQIINSQSFTIRYATNNEGLRAAVVVSKKVDKRSVVRNRIKRQIVEAVRKRLPIESQFSVVFYAKRNAIDNKNLEDEVEQRLKEIKN